MAKYAIIWTIFVISIFVVQSNQAELDTEDAKAKKGVCPKVTSDECSPADMINNECLIDVDCPLEMKCCSDGCQLKCMAPQLSKEAEICTVPVELGFLIDASGSIGQDNFDKIKEFVKKIVAAFEVSEQGTHVGAIWYSDKAQVAFDFNNFTGSNLNQANIFKAVDTIQVTTGKTRIDLALRLAYKDLYSAKGGVRFDKPKILLVMTDGRQTRGVEASDAEGLHVASRPLKELGVQVYSLGIGPDYDIGELLDIASDDASVFRAASFDELLSIVASITEQTCKGCTKPVDIHFAVDSSNNIDPNQFALMKHFLAAFSDKFVVSKRGARISASVYADDAKLVFDLYNDHSSEEEVKKSIDKIPHLQQSGTNMDKALRLAHNNVFQLRGGTRQGVAKVLILLSTGSCSGCKESLLDAVKPLKEGGVKVISLAIGNKYNIADLEKVSSLPPSRHIFGGSGFEQLMNVVTIQKISAAACQGKPGKCTVVQRPPFCPASITYKCEIDTDCPGEEKCCLDPCDMTCKPPKLACITPVDFAFAFQSTAGVGQAGFKHMKEFAANVIDSFRVSEVDTHVSLIKYGKSPKVVLNFNQVFSAKKIQSEIESVPFEAMGASDIPALLRTAREEIFSAKGSSRLSVPRVLVLFTDGVIPAADEAAIKVEAAKLKKAHGGVDVLVLGIGASAKNSPVLKELGKGRRRLFELNSYEDLLGYKASMDLAKELCEAKLPVKECEEVESFPEGGCLVQQDECDEDFDCPGEQQCCYDDCRKTCKPTPRTSCGSQIDLLIALDDSAKVGVENFAKMKNFAQALVKSFDANGTRVAAASYSDAPRIHFDFKDVKSLEKVLAGIGSIPFASGDDSRLDQMLEMAYDNVFTRSAGHRKNGTRAVMVIFTDGNTAVGSKRLDLASWPLRSQDTRIIAISVGKANLKSMENVVSLPVDKNVFMAASFDDVEKNIREISKLSCQPALLQPSQPTVYKPGPDGPAGPKGFKGNPGPDGGEGETGPGGDPGEPGKKGPRGPQGPEGEAGPQGLPGGKSTKGPDPRAPEVGVEGTGTIQVFVAKPGGSGPPGPPGKPGPAGPAGDKGPTGPKGRPGAKGPVGPFGEAGPAGVPGKNGEDGPNGEPGDPGNPGEQGIMGANGLAGGQGDFGYKGEKGLVGKAGEFGEAGRPGEKGYQGEKGAQGEAGPMGPKGEVGQIGPDGPMGQRGPRGQQGPIGTPGNPGPDGEKGKNGLPGLSGEKGRTGARGQRGVKGVSGDKGEVGAEGSKGAAGPKGQRGTEGAEGLKGERGEAGPAGPPGLLGEPGEPGDQGAEGPLGLAGPRGDDGSRGAVGVTGSKGAVGDPGLRGPPGAQGPPGGTGQVGRPGPPGPQGTAGETGQQGRPGEQGRMGNAGLKGANGEAGDGGKRGEKGSRGSTGLAGVKGASGPRGEPGRPGNAGRDGKPGSRGAPGKDGQLGPAGRMGQEGNAGAIGARGPTGAVGPTGPAGKDGSIGRKGAVGDIGTQGEEGDVGRPGDIGAPGLGGRQGLRGPTGIQGPPGVAGSTGTPGKDGAAGPKGKSGQSGDPGAPGPAGPNGQPGMAGMPGQPGADGSRGESGARGARGDPGLPGAAGRQGAQGVPGLPGNVGVTGTAGAKGQMGLSGAKGERGSDGQPGSKGPEGPIGLTGPRGSPGAPGLDGNPGEPGNPGAPGSPGERGPSGAKGRQGLSGERGNPGVPGKPGDKGETGPTGDGGPDGEAGPVGKIGKAGSSGERGIRGPRGPPGVAGERGVRGVTGPPGPIGLEGTVGPPGPPGLAGKEGPKGPPGDKGDEGAAGSAGPDGSPGKDGTPGKAGASGKVGSPGPDGIRGPPGNQGGRGPAGRPGRIGAIGAPGPKGFPGKNGANGLDGKAGVEGKSGPDGVAGEMGPTGEDGKPGTNGENGEDGSPGPQGDLGSRGFPGSDGERGDRGPQGPAGAAGQQGETGFQGDSGKPGKAGKPGSQGPDGEAGPDGTDGAAGSQGRRGRKGRRGMQGIPGPQGPRGEKGDRGYDGPAGPPGFSGPRGEPGDDGPTGPEGAIGPDGPDGPRGREGSRGDGGDPGAPGRAGSGGLPGPPGPPGEITGLSEAFAGYFTSAGFEKGPVYYNYYRRSTSQKEGDQIINRNIEGFKKYHDTLKDFDSFIRGSGTREFPARTCRDLFLWFPDMKSGDYWIDPNEGAIDDAVRVFCNRTTNETCIYAKNPELEQSKWHRGRDMYKWALQDILKEHEGIEYAANMVQLKMLKLLSVKARQNVTYICKNSHAWKDGNNKIVMKTMKVATDNFQEVHGRSMFKDLRTDVIQDECTIKDGKTRQTILELTTNKLKYMPIMDVAGYDIGGNKEEFGLKVGPVCFS